MKDIECEGLTQLEMSAGIHGDLINEAVIYASKTCSNVLNQPIIVDCSVDVPNSWRVSDEISVPAHSDEAGFSLIGGQISV